MGACVPGAEGQHSRVPTRRVTLYLDQDIVAIFKAEARRGGLPYQVAITQALHRFRREREQDPQTQGVESVLRALGDDRVRGAIRKMA